MLQIIIHPAADQEIIHASAYLEEQREGFGYLFLDSLQNALEHIGTYPLSMQIKSGSMRELHIKRFNYVVVYEIHMDQLHVYHVVHSSRQLSRRYSKK